MDRSRPGAEPVPWRRQSTGSSRAGRLAVRVPLTDLHGRRDDIHSLTELLDRSRIVTLVGPGGVGKTRLALEVAAVAQDRFADGAWLCELAPVESGVDVIPAVATGLGVRQRGAALTTQVVIDWLAPRQILVVFDNCEHVLGAVRPLVRDILRQCSGATLLLTSREAIGVDGEWCWLTKPLAVPPIDVTDPAAATCFDAVTLFSARAKAAKRDFELSSDNVKAVAAICRRLDGIPLALELAAARIAALGASDLLDQLDHRFRVLVGTSGEPRRTLRGAVDWSYDLLDDRQQNLFRRLAVFPGSWSIEAAQAVCVDDDFTPLDVVDLLTGLVTKSLVSLVSTPTGTRYEMLETLRHYGLERLLERGEADQLKRRHARWVRSMVHHASQGLRGIGERASGDLISAELDNLRAAVAWAVANNEPDTAFAIIASLEDYLLLRLDFEVAAWAERLLLVEDWRNEPLRHHAAGAVAQARWASGDLDDALRLGDEAIAHERRFGSSPSWAAWQAVGDAAWFKGSSGEAVRHFREWATHARAMGDEFHLALALTHVTVAAALVEPGSDVNEVADEAIALARHCASPSLIALALYAKSELVIDDDPFLAHTLVQEGASIGRQSGNRFAYGLCLTTLASLTGRLGDETKALELYRTAIENWQQAGNWTNQRILLRNLAELAARLGEYELTARLVGALDASGDMLGADIGGEGGRLGVAVEAAQQALGQDRYTAVTREAAGVHPLALASDTLTCIDQMLAALRANAPGAATQAAPTAGLSPREWEIVTHVASGLENRQIAQRLFISERTVDTHMTRIRRKLGITTRTQLAVWGVEHGARTRR